MTTASAAPGTSWDDAAHDRRDLVGAWARAAEDADDLDLAAELWRQVDSEQGASGRARVALLHGDAAGALALLEGQGAADVPADGPRSLDHLVVLGCRAALGRPDDMSRLVAVGASIAPQLRLLYLYVLGAAAEGARRHDLADEVWRSVVVDHGVRTSYALSRFLASWVQHRPRTDAKVVVGHVASAAYTLADAVPRPWEDAAALGATTSALMARGDTAGAALLTTAVSRLGPRSEAVDALVTGLAPRRRLLPRVVPVAVLVLATVVSAVVLRHGLPGAAVGLAALWAARRWWSPVQGWTLADGQAWVGFDALHHDATSGAPKERATQLRLVPTIATLVGAAIGAVLGTTWWEWAAQPVNGVPLPLSGVVGGVLWFGVPAFALWAGVRGEREHRRHVEVRRRVAEDALLHRQATACRCWETSAMVGRHAYRYATEHLVDAPSPVPQVRRDATVRVCPLSGMRWLATTSETAASALLLRGPAAAAPRPSAPPGEGGYL